MVHFFVYSINSVQIKSQNETEPEGVICYPKSNIRVCIVVDFHAIVVSRVFALMELRLLNNQDVFLEEEWGRSEYIDPK